MAAPKICMVGSCMTDLVARTPRLPGAGETLFGTSFQVGFGGKGANQAVMAARLGADVSVVVKLGRDSFGDNTLKNFQEQGCDTTYFLWDETGLSSGVAPIWVEETTGQNSIIIVPGANSALSPADVRAAHSAIESAQLVICQLEIPLETTLEAFRVAKAAGVKTILNPAPAAALPDELLALTDILVPNEVEAAMLTGMPASTVEQAEAAARALRARGVGTVIITLGDRGALILNDAGAQHVAVERVQAVDSTGAGDAFVGTLGYALAAGRSLGDAVRTACAIATRSVLKTGTQTSFPYRAEVEQLL
jgi:ribokinase